jgi:hypothetical protein
MRLARPVVGPDGAVVAGVGTTLTPPLVRMLLAMGVDGVWIDTELPVADWEEAKDCARALADLAARFAYESPDPVRDALEAALRAHLLAKADAREADPS